MGLLVHGDTVGRAPLARRRRRAHHRLAAMTWPPSVGRPRPPQYTSRRRPVRPRSGAIGFASAAVDVGVERRLVLGRHPLELRAQRQVRVRPADARVHLEVVRPRSAGGSAGSSSSALVTRESSVRSAIPPRPMLSAVDDETTPLAHAARHAHRHRDAWARAAIEVVVEQVRRQVRARICWGVLKSLMYAGRPPRRAAHLRRRSVTVLPKTITVARGASRPRAGQAACSRSSAPQTRIERGRGRPRPPSRRDRPR